MQRALGEAQYAEQLTTAELRLREELLARLDDSNPDNPGAPSSNSNDGGNSGGAATAAAASAAASPPPAKRQRTTAHALSSSSASIHSSQSTSPGESLSQEEPLSYTELQWRHNRCRGRLHELDTPALRVADSAFVASLSSPLPRVPVLTLGHLTALDAFYCQTGGSHIADGGSSGGSGSTPSFSQDLRDFGMDDSEESGATTARRNPDAVVGQLLRALVAWLPMLPEIAWLMNQATLLRRAASATEEARRRAAPGGARGSSAAAVSSSSASSSSPSSAEAAAALEASAATTAAEVAETMFELKREETARLLRGVGAEMERLYARARELYGSLLSGEPGVLDWSPGRECTLNSTTSSQSSNSFGAGVAVGRGGGGASAASPNKPGGARYREAPVGRRELAMAGAPELAVWHERLFAPEVVGGGGEVSRRTSEAADTTARTTVGTAAAAAAAAAAAPELSEGGSGGGSSNSSSSNRQGALAEMQSEDGEDQEARSIVGSIVASPALRSSLSSIGSEWQVCRVCGHRWAGLAQHTCRGPRRCGRSERLDASQPASIAEADVHADASSLAVGAPIPEDRSESYRAAEPVSGPGFHLTSHRSLEETCLVSDIHVCCSPILLAAALLPAALLAAALLALCGGRRIRAVGWRRHRGRAPPLLVVKHVPVLLALVAVVFDLVHELAVHVLLPPRDGGRPPQALLAQDLDVRSRLHDGVPRLLRRLVHPQPLPPLPLALPRRRKGVVRAALLHAGQHVRGAHRLDVHRLLRRRLGRAARCLALSALPLALVVCCSALDAAALVHARRLRCHLAAGRRPTANFAQTPCKAPSNARKRRLSNLGARPLSGRVPPLSDLLHSLFTYIKKTDNPREDVCSPVTVSCAPPHLARLSSLNPPPHPVAGLAPWRAGPTRKRCTAFQVAASTSRTSWLASGSSRRAPAETCARGRARPRCSS